MFAQFDVPAAGYVVSRVIPHELLNQNIPDYLRRRIAMQPGRRRRARYCERRNGPARSETLACADAPCAETVRSHIRAARRFR